MMGKFKMDVLIQEGLHDADVQHGQHIKHDI
jgi:hypothetical protein